MRVEVTFPELEPGINIQEQVCLIPISVGQKYHDPEEFESSLSQLAEKNYAKYVIVVADLLQHYTELMRNTSLSQKDAEGLAIQKGDSWVSQSLPIIERVLEGKPFKVVRWLECLSDPLFDSVMAETRQKYESNEIFQSGIDELVEKYLNSFDNKGKKLKGSVSSKITEKNPEYLRKEALCRAYVLEETALIMVWQNKACNFAWMPYSQCFFLAYAFGGHSSNQAIYEHLTKLCQGSSYQLINIKVSLEPKKQKKEKDEREAKIEMMAGALLTMLKASGMPLELQLATTALVNKKISTKLGVQGVDSLSLKANTEQSISPSFSPAREKDQEISSAEKSPAAAYAFPVFGETEEYGKTPDTSRASTASSTNSSAMYLGRTSLSSIQGSAQANSFPFIAHK